MSGGEGRAPAGWGAKIPWRWIRWLGSLGLLLLLFTQIDFGEFVALLADVRPLPAVAAFAVGLSLLAMAAWRWRCLIGPELGVPYATFLKLTFVGAFAGLFLPGTVGNEAVRLMGLARVSGETTKAAASVVVDRLLSLFAQFALAFFLIAFAPAGVPADLSIWAAVGLFCMLAGAGLSLSRRFHDLALRLIARSPLKGLAAPVAKALDALETYRNPKLMLEAVVLALIFQAQRAVFLWICAAALGSDIGVMALLIALPAVSIVEMAPVTVAGIGAREAGFAFVLAQFGVDPAQAVAMSLLAFLLGTVLASLPGAWWFAREGFGARRRTDPFREG